AHAAEVPIIVAVNKIDLPDAQPDRVVQELTKFDLVSEAWGGDTLFVNTSATKGTGIEELLEAIHLQAEILELKANPNRKAQGTVVEAKLDRGRGPVATVLIESGTLHCSDTVVVGETYGKIRAMTDHTGKPMKSAGPSDAVELIGLDLVPDAGDLLNVVDSSDQAKEVAGYRVAQKKAQEDTSGPRMTLEDLMARMEGNETLELRVVLKADVQGSVEAVRDALLNLSTDEVEVNVLHGGVGGINESDIMLASASDGIVLGFGVRPDNKTRSIADREAVEIRTYRIIYELIDDVRKAMEDKLEPERHEKIVGHAAVRELFKVSKVGTIAGCRVTDGKAVRSVKVRVLRDSVEIYQGKVGSLKHFKDDAREVESGQECGVGVEGFNDIKVNDVLEFFQVEEIARKLDSTPAGQRPSGNAEAHP
ncbi:MAG: translation initiation factor IF-2, partial [Myxococcota bacterium]